MSYAVSRKDFGAGLVGAFATLPQAVAYGLVAVSPLGAEWAVFGIGASVGSAILFGLLTGAFGSNPFLLSGPRAVTALVLATGIQTALGRGYEAEVAIALAFGAVIVAGVFQVLAGLMRLGYAVSYIPLPVLAGFVNASALLVLIGSIPMIVGLPDQSLASILSGEIGNASVWALLVAGLTIAVNFGLEGRIRLLPAALLGLVAGAVVYHMGISLFSMTPGPEVGHIDLLRLIHPPFELVLAPSWSVIVANADIALLTGVSIGLLATFDTVLSSSALDMQEGTTSNSNRDLTVHGATNLVMGALGFLPGSGTLSRSTAIINSGATSRAANVAASLAFLAMVGLLAPIVAVLPLWATSGMLAATAIQAIDKPTVQRIKDILQRNVPYPRVLLGDVVVTLVVVVTAFAFSLTVAVGVGVILAVILFVLGMGRDPVRRTFSAANVHSKTQRPPKQMQCLNDEGHRIHVVELQGALFFGACARLQANVRDLILSGAEYVILDFRYLSSIDSTGAATLRTLAMMCSDAGGQLMISCLEPERRLDPMARQQYLRDTNQNEAPASLRWIWLSLQANGVISRISEERIFDSTDTALSMCEDLILARLGRTEVEGKRGIISNSAIFEGLDRQQIAALGRYAKRHRFAEDETVFRQGDKGDTAYLLVMGRMDILIDIPGSVRKRRVSGLVEGTFFGEMGLLDQAPRSANVVAIESSACLSIDSVALKQLHHDHPDVALILMRNLSRQFADRLRLANNMISELER